MPMEWWMGEWCHMVMIRCMDLKERGGRKAFLWSDYRKPLKNPWRQSRLEMCTSQVRHIGVVLSCLDSLVWLLTAWCQSSWYWNVFGIQEFYQPLLN
jgi:hypothetical protein